MNENIAPAPFFQDPVYGAPTDPVIIWNKEENQWWLLYTQRRPSSVDVGVSGIHGTKIGVASSRDGLKWLYRGTLPDLDFEPGHNTFWAPEEVIWAGGQYHMYVSYITGIPTDWNYERHIIHYTAANMWEWKFESILQLSSDRVIDACVYETEPGKYKMWYKDEAHKSYTYAAESRDLYNWSVIGGEICDCPHEGPNVFELDGCKWMITDCWDGLGVYKSNDFTDWSRQGGDNPLKDNGTRRGDGGKGHHADVIVRANRAYIVYFVHSNPTQKSMAVVQIAELELIEGKLICDRNKEIELKLL